MAVRHGSGTMLSAIDELKFHLLKEGIVVRDSAKRAWVERYGNLMTLGEYPTTSGICLALPDRRYVNAPVDNRSGSELVYDGDAGFQVQRKEEAAVSVRIVPVAPFHFRTIVDRIDGVERPMSRYGVTHTDRVRISPIAGCAMNCRFCNIPYTLAYRRKHVRDLLDVIEAAQDDEIVPARHVLISGGAPRGREGIGDHNWIDHVYGEIAQQSPLPVEVMMPPRFDMTYPARLRSFGVDTLTVNIEAFDANRIRMLAPQKAAYSRERFLDYIQAAVEAFGIGHVQSLILVGKAIEPFETTMQGVQELVARGSIPILSAFRPDANTPMGNEPPATYDEVVRAYQATLKLCLDAKVLPGPRCVECHHNVAVVPTSSGIDRGFYTTRAELSSSQTPIRPFLDGLEGFPHVTNV